MANSPEVSGVNLGVVGAVVKVINHCVPIVILLARVALPVPVGVHLIRVVDEVAVVQLVGNAVVVSIRVTLVADAIFVGVVLVAVDRLGAVVQIVVDAVPLGCCW